MLYTARSPVLAQRKLGHNGRFRCISTSAKSTDRSRQRRKILETLVTQQADRNSFYDRFYTITYSAISSAKGGPAVLKAYNGSIELSITCEFPEHAWEAWRFHAKNTRHFRQIHDGLNHPHQQPLALASLRHYLEYVMHEVKATELDQLRLAQLPAHVRYNLDILGGLERVLAYVKSQGDPLLTDIPVVDRERANMVKKFSNTSPDFWLDLTNQRMYWENMKTLLGHETKQDSWDNLYRVTPHDVASSGGRALLTLHQDSICLAVMHAVPEYDWQPWLFVQGPPTSWWQNLASQFRNLEALDDTTKQRTLLLVRHWLEYLATTEAGRRQRRSKRTKKIVKWLGGVKAIVQRVFNVEERKRWRLPKSESETVLRRKSRYWNHPRNRAKFLQVLGRQLGLQSFADWYSVTNKTILAGGGRILLRLYKDSATRAILSEMPDHAWRPWHFTSTPIAWWGNLVQLFNTRRPEIRDPIAETVVRLFVEEVAQTLEVTQLDDWQLVNLNNIDANTMKRLNSLGGLLPLLTTLYPEHNWTAMESKSLSSIQKHIATHTKAILG